MRSTSPSGITIRRALLAPGRRRRPSRNARRLAMRSSRSAANSRAARNPLQVLLTLDGFHLLDQVVAPALKVPDAEHPHRFARERAGQVLLDPADVAEMSTS